MPFIIAAKIPDSSIIELFDSLEERFGLGQRTLKLYGIPLINVPDELRDVTKSTSFLTDAIFISNGNSIKVKLHRNYENSPYFDALEINADANATPKPTAEMLLDVDSAIRHFIKLPVYNSPFGEGSPMHGVLERELSAIASMHKGLMNEVLSLRSKQEEYDLEQRKKLEAERQAALEKTAKYEEESIARIKSEKAELDAKIQEFDFSDHMRARRTLREQITTDVQASLAKPVSTRETQTKFFVLTAVCVLVSFGAGILAYESFEAFISAASPAADINDGVSLASDGNVVSNVPPANTYLIWMLAVRGAILSAVAIGFAYYLISMFRKSYDEDTRNLRELQRYGMDINRASWIIETAMEMQTKENATLPPAWIEGACAGLFHTSASKDSDVTSLSALGAVLGIGPEIEVGPDGARMKITPKSAKAAARSA